MLKYINRPPGQRGFGLIELVVTVAILGVLMLVAILVFGAIQKTAATNVTKSNMEQLITAIDVARAKQNKTLLQITGNACTGCVFWEAGAADPLTLDSSARTWTVYNATLKKISDASGMDVTRIKDAHGRPLYIDENEGEGDPPRCTRDGFASLSHPYVARSTENSMSLYTYKC